MGWKRFVLWLVCTAACFDPDPEAGAPCSELGDCPSGLVCSKGTCVEAGASECESQPDGTPCGSADVNECDAADTCQAGACVRNVVPDGAACGDPTATECDAGDTCQAGVCATNIASDGAPCGDPAAGECDQADSCLAGQCEVNHVGDGSTCGAGANGPCDAQDTCAAGQCAANILNDGTTCNGVPSGSCDAQDTCSSGACINNLVPDGTNCNGTPVGPCDAQGTCSNGSCAGDLAPPGTACGSTAASTCDAADTCNGLGTCLQNYANSGSACGSATVTSCDNADTCNGSGTCQPNYRTVGTMCGSQTDTDCNNPDTCNTTGSCLSNLVADTSVCYDCGAGVGDCNSCSTGTCTSATCVSDGAQSGQLVATPAISGTSEDGNMFEVTAAASLTITGFQQNFTAANAAASYEIYFRRGTMAGFQQDSTAWTLVGSATFAVTGTPTLTTVPIPVSIALAAGERVSFYLTNTAASPVNNRYHTGTAVGTLAADDGILATYEGISLVHPFGGTIQDRVWEGSISYTTVGSGGPTTPVTTDTSGSSTSDGVMFDVTATNNLRVSRLGVNINAGGHDIDVYFRRDTHVGFSASASGWEMIATTTNTPSAGAGVITDIPVPLSVFVAAGQTVAFYITKGNGTNEIRSGAGTSVGATAASTGDITIKQGIEVSNLFEPMAGAVIQNVRVTYSTCAP